MGTFCEISHSNRDEYEDGCFYAVQAGINWPVPWWWRQLVHLKHREVS